MLLTSVYLMGGTGISMLTAGPASVSVTHLSPLEMMTSGSPSARKQPSRESQGSPRWFSPWLSTRREVRVRIHFKSKDDSCCFLSAGYTLPFASLCAARTHTQIEWMEYGCFLAQCVAET